MPNNYFSTFLKYATRTELIHEAKSAWDFLLQNGEKLDKEAESTKPSFITNPKKLIIGQMYLFIYDAKLKEILPYYDRHPLIFPIGMSGDQFMGINLHYLPIGARMRLMDALYDLASGEANKKTLQISYQILKGASKYRYFKPCVHSYLNHYIRSTFMIIPSDQWKKALLLPTQSFSGARVSRVYSDSVNKY